MFTWVLVLTGAVIPVDWCWPLLFGVHILAVSCEDVSLGICRQQRPRSDCTDVSTQSDRGLHCLLTESLDTAECMNGEQWPK